MEEILETLLKLALSKHASDIHFHSEHGQLSIQLRTMSGMEVLDQDVWKPSFFEFLKFYSHFDLTNPYMPQSGHFEYSIYEKTIFCRFSVIANYEFQTGVLRILNANSNLKINDLTKNSEHIASLKSLCTMRQGLVISAGPTNTGKTTTLHAILHEIALEKRFKVVSLEDPVEIEDSLYVQLQINESIGFTYEKGIEELLRHDPDVIFIGETRNAYTAKMVVRAALTGHLVFTTLHAKNGLETIQRLYDFGLTAFDLQNTLSMILSQRLYSTDKKGGKQCIYEILKKADIQYILKNNAYPDSFCTLDREIKKALQQRDICDEQAFFDLKNF